MSRVATNMSMPALSPTMTEGNIASWKLKEGDSFSAGDVLVEIETDKATMDVEATDDGILAKILVGDGQKNVSVGSRIAVTAEPGDDLASLEMPQDSSDTTTKDPSTESSAVKAVPEMPVTKESLSPSAPSRAKKSTTGPGEAKKPVFSTNGPSLSPAVQSLMSRMGFSDHSSIKATGPNGRLLKGDILAHGKKIDGQVNEAIASAYAKRSKLDLSDIKRAPQAKKVDKAAEKEPQITNPIIELRKNIDLARLVQYARKATEKSAVEVSVQSLLSKATTRAIHDVPSFALAQPLEYDLLFDEIVGDRKRPAQPLLKDLSPTTTPKEAFDVSTHFVDGRIPLPTGAPESALFELLVAPSSMPTSGFGTTQEVDILDFIIDGTSSPSARRSSSVPAPAPSEMIASLSFRKDVVDAKIASIYLDRVVQYVESPAHLFL